MDVVRKVVGVVTVLGMLAGCASTPPPAMTPQQYQQFASEWGVLQRCINQGLISAETGARGQGYYAATLNNFSYSMERMGAEMNRQEAEAKEIDPASCNRLAVSVAEYKRQVDINNAVVDQDRESIENALEYIQNSKPVFCNTIGDITLCN